MFPVNFNSTPSLDIVSGIYMAGLTHYHAKSPALSKLLAPHILLLLSASAGRFLLLPLPIFKGREVVGIFTGQFVHSRHLEIHICLEEHYLKANEDKTGEMTE